MAPIELEKERDHQTVAWHTHTHKIITRYYWQCSIPKYMNKYLIIWCQMACSNIVRCMVLSAFLLTTPIRHLVDWLKTVIDSEWFQTDFQHRYYHMITTWWWWWSVVINTTITTIPSLHMELTSSCLRERSLKKNGFINIIDTEYIGNNQLMNTSRVINWILANWPLPNTLYSFCIKEVGCWSVVGSFANFHNVFQ